MSFQQILYIWLAVLLAAFVSGSVAHIMDGRTRNLSGGSYHATLILPQSESNLCSLVFSRRELSTADQISALLSVIARRRAGIAEIPAHLGTGRLTGCATDLCQQVITAVEVVVVGAGAAPPPG